jgi:hypothetical protein
LPQRIEQDHLDFLDFGLHSVLQEIGFPKLLQIVALDAEVPQIQLEKFLRQRLVCKLEGE